jgi:hypothetical protein
VKDERLQTSFWLSEFIRSDTATRKGIENIPSEDALNNIRIVLAPGMQRVRNVLQVPVNISSGYRSAALNATVGGAKNSQHLLGQAADFTAPEFGSPLAIVKKLALYANFLQFDQLIQEGDWVHISFASGVPRLQILTAHFGEGGTTYTEGVA